MNRGILVVQAIDWAKSATSSAVIQASLARCVFPFAEVLRRYRGIDGLAWPELRFPELVELNNGLAPVTSFGKVLQYVLGTPEPDACRILCCDLVRNKDHRLDEEAGTEFCGYDVGLWFSDYAAGGPTYSAVFHETLFGQISSLRSFSNHLNQKLLFRSSAQALEFLKCREVAIAQGHDLEESCDDCGMEVIAVSEFTRPGGPPT